MSTIVKKVFFDYPAENTAEAIEFLSEQAVKLGIADDKDAVLAAFQEREAQGPTGMTRGFALPHAKSAAIKDVALTIAAKVSATGQLYGSVGANQVAEELKKLGKEVDRKIITMKDAKQIGDYVALVHYHKEVTVEIPVKVIAENAAELKAAAEEEAAIRAAAEAKKAAAEAAAAAAEEAPAEEAEAEIEEAEAPATEE